MNSIAEIQNQPENIRLLKAQRSLYTIARGYRLMNFFVSVPLIVLFSILVTFMIGIDLLFAYISVIVLVVSYLLNHLSNDLREKAAYVQDVFDREVLGVDTNTFFSTNSVKVEEIKYYADRITNKDSESLKDWYPTAVSSLPVEYARLVCQRASCYWNYSERKIYRNILVAMGIISSLIVLTLGIISNAGLGDILLYAIFPLLPIANWSIREILAQNNSIRALENLHGKIERVFKKILSKQITIGDLDRVSDDLQAAIFIRRSGDSMVPSFIYWWSRDRKEGEMNFGAEKLVGKIEKVINHN